MLKVLIVDDSKIIQRVLAAQLVAMGHSVVGCGNDGEEGVAMFAELRPELTMLDITMPNQDGRECLDKILKLDPAARVVMCSALKSQTVVDGCLKSGALGFVEKEQLGNANYLRDKLSAILNLQNSQ